MRAECLVQQQRHYLRRQYIYFRFKLQACVAVRSGSCICSATDHLGGPCCVVVLPKGVPPPGLGGVGIGSSPYLATVHIFYVLCLPSERGMGLSMPWQFQSRVEVLRDVRVHGSSCGSYRDVLHSPWTRSTIVATAAVVTTCSVFHS